MDVIIGVGYRVNSVRAVQFRQWSTGVLRDFALRGYVVDKELKSIEAPIEAPIEARIVEVDKA